MICRIWFPHILDTSIAELVKEITVSDSFQEALQIEQDLLNGVDTDKVCPYIEDFICKQEPLTKVLEYTLNLFLKSTDPISILSVCCRFYG